MFYRSIALAIAAMTALGASSTQAQEYVNIVLANHVVARIRSAGQFSSLYEREARINQRITNALANELAAIFPGPHTTKAKVTVTKVDGRYALVVGKTLLIEVFPQDAAGAGTDPKTLIYQWQDNFATYLPQAVSPIKVPPWYKGPRGGDVPSAPLPSGLPPEDEPLVDALVREMARIRAMSAEEFEARQEALEAGIIAMVCNYRQPEGFPDPPTSLLRVRSLFTVLRGAGMSDAKFTANKRMYAGQTIRKIREEFNVPAGRGPIPSADEIVLPDTCTPPTPATPQPPVTPETPVTPTEAPTMPAPWFAENTPIARAMLGTGLDANNQLLNPGQQFPADAPLLMLYLQVEDAPPNTIVGVIMRIGETIIGKRMLNLTGDRTLAVSFYPQSAERFTPGDYVCEITVGEEVAVSIPFRVGTL